MNASRDKMVLELSLMSLMLFRTGRVPFISKRPAVNSLITHNISRPLDVRMGNESIEGEG